MPKEILEAEDCVDIVTIGEAEVTFLKLLNVFDNKNDLKEIDGIAYRENGKIIKSKDADKIKDLDYFPIPDRDLIKLNLYRPSVSYYKRLPAYTMITTRGCTYRCTFCATAKTGYRMHSIPRVVEEMKLLVEKYGAKQILLRDDTFTLNKKIKWDCITGAGLVDFDLLKKMKSAGCWGIHFGVEGGTQKLLNAINK